MFSFESYSRSKELGGAVANCGTLGQGVQGVPLHVRLRAAVDVGNVLNRDLLHIDSRPWCFSDRLRMFAADHGGQDQALRGPRQTLRPDRRPPSQIHSRSGSAGQETSDS